MNNETKNKISLFANFIVLGGIFLTLISINMNISNKNIQQSENNSVLINTISEKILSRDVVPDTYFNYIQDKALLENIKTYNGLTARMTLDCTAYAMDIVLVICYLPEDNMSTSALHYYKISEENKVIIKKIAKYALYRNATELIWSDSDIAPIIAGEYGGSAGQWARFIREDGGGMFDYTILDEDGLNDYFDLIDSIILDLNKIK